MAHGEIHLPGDCKTVRECDEEIGQIDRDLRALDRIINVLLRSRLQLVTLRHDLCDQENPQLLTVDRIINGLAEPNGSEPVVTGELERIWPKSTHQNLIDLFTENGNQPLSMTEIAGKMNLSYARADKVIKQELKKTFNRRRARLGWVYFLAGPEELANGPENKPVGPEKTVVAPKEAAPIPTFIRDRPLLDRAKVFLEVSGPSKAASIAAHLECDYQAAYRLMISNPLSFQQVGAAEFKLRTYS